MHNVNSILWLVDDDGGLNVFVLTLLLRSFLNNFTLQCSHAKRVVLE